MVTHFMNKTSFSSLFLIIWTIQTFTYYRQRQENMVYVGCASSMLISNHGQNLSKDWKENRLIYSFFFVLKSENLNLLTRHVFTKNIFTMSDSSVQKMYTFNGAQETTLIIIVLFKKMDHFY